MCHGKCKGRQVRRAVTPAGLYLYEEFDAAIVTAAMEVLSSFFPSAGPLPLLARHSVIDKRAPALLCSLSRCLFSSTPPTYDESVTREPIESTQARPHTQALHTGRAASMQYMRYQSREGRLAGLNTV